MQQEQQPVSIKMVLPMSSVTSFSLKNSLIEVLYKGRHRVESNPRRSSLYDNNVASQYQSYPGQSYYQQPVPNYQYPGNSSTRNDKILLPGDI